MLTYSFSDIGSESLYIHLYNCIKKDIITGKLSSNTKLPSKRSFAKNLGISVITVENAYALLQSEGYIYSLPKKGFYVCDISVIPPTYEKRNISIPERPLLNQTYFADFVSNRTIPENFPFYAWAKLLRETISEKKDELMITPDAGGVMELRVAICEHLKEFRNMDVSPEQIIIGAGTDYLYTLIIQLLGHDKIYAIENPGYEKIAQVYSANNVSYRYINLDKSGIIVHELEAENTDVAHISPSHHFPTGIVTPIGRRYELLSWANKKNSRYIIEDDYDSEFRLTGKPIPTLQSIDSMQKVIYMNTFTKSLAPTIRISYMILPETLLEKYYRELGFYSNTVSNFEQYTLAKFIKKGHFEKHINRMRNYYKGIRNELLDTIRKSPLSSKITILEEESGLHFLMQIDTDQPDEVIIERAKNAGINVAFLSQYYKNDTAIPASTNHTMILNYSGIKAENISTAINKLLNIILTLY